MLPEAKTKTLCVVACPHSPRTLDGCRSWKSKREKRELLTVSKAFLIQMREYGSSLLQLGPADWAD
jgi:hypothetical protein